MKICILSAPGLADEMIKHTKTVLEAVCKSSYLSLEFCHGQPRGRRTAKRHSFQRNHRFVPDIGRSGVLFTGNRCLHPQLLGYSPFQTGAFWLYAFYSYFPCAGFLRYGERNHRFRYRLFNRAGGMVGQHAARSRGKKSLTATSVGTMCC